MSQYRGSLRMKGDVDDSPLRVVIDVLDERISIHSGSTLIGSWPLDGVGVRSDRDGIHLRIDGEEAVIRTDDDGNLALDLGLRGAEPWLRRQMGVAIRNRG